MTVSYDHSFGPVGLGVGYIYYALDGTDDTQEFYVSLGGDVLLAPTLTVYRDVDEYHGWYIDLGLSHSFDLPYEMTLDLGASCAYYISDNDSIVDYDHNGDPTTSRFKNFQNGLLSVGMTIPFVKIFLPFAPMIAYSFPLGGAADKNAERDQPEQRRSSLFRRGDSLHGILMPSYNPDMPSLAPAVIQRQEGLYRRTRRPRRAALTVWLRADSL